MKNVLTQVKPVIINVLGTCGAGKSTAVRQVIEALDGQPLFKDKKVWGYNLQNRVFVVGSYEKVTAGTDALPSAEIHDRIRRLARLGSVIFEGLFVSSCYGKFRQLEDELKPTHRWMWACLDTPYETCLARTRQRRSEANRDKPFKTTGIQRVFRSVISTRRTLQREGRDVRTLPHLDTLTPLLDWLGERNASGQHKAA